MKTDPAPNYGNIHYIYHDVFRNTINMNELMRSTNIITINDYQLFFSHSYIPTYLRTSLQYQQNNIFNIFVGLYQINDNELKLFLYQNDFNSNYDIEHNSFLNITSHTFEVKLTKDIYNINCWNVAEIKKYVMPKITYGNYREIYQHMKLDNISDNNISYITDANIKYCIYNSDDEDVSS